MTALSHSFKTEVHNTGNGAPSILSRHIDAMCPPTQDEDEWMEQELDRARQQRGTFYKKLANSRTASLRELDDLSASKTRSMSRGSTERELSPSASGSTASPPPGMPEPHSSWRFYTSFDNGEWKRHCVPVYKSEEDILAKSPSTESKDKGSSPAYESHLRKYRQARSSLFDRPPSRKFLSTSPREETSTVRVVSSGNDALGTRRLPFDRSPQDLMVRTMGDDLLGNPSPNRLPSNYKEEVTTSETITTTHGEPEVEKKVTSGSGKDANRPKHHNLGYKEKVIVPTKYKTDAEKAELAARRKSEVAEKENKIPERKDPDADKPSYLGSTFEKFDYKAVPLVQPQFSNRKPGFNLPASRSNREEFKRKPIFDSQPFSRSSPAAKPNEIMEDKKSVKPSFNESGFVDMSFSPSSSFQTSTPHKASNVEFPPFCKSSLPFQNVITPSSVPVHKPIAGRQVEVSNPPANEIQKPCETAPIFGNEFSAFSAPSPQKTRSQTAPNCDDGVNDKAAPSDEEKKEIIFIPVIRVVPQNGDTPTDRSIAKPGGHFPAIQQPSSFSNPHVFDLEEDPLTSPEFENKRHQWPVESPYTRVPAIIVDSPTTSTQPGDVEERLENKRPETKSSSQPSDSVSPSADATVAVKKQKPVFPGDPNYKAQRDTPSQASQVEPSNSAFTSPTDLRPASSDPDDTPVNSSPEPMAPEPETFRPAPKYTTSGERIIEPRRPNRNEEPAQPTRPLVEPLSQPLPKPAPNEAASMFTPKGERVIEPSTKKYTPSGERVLEPSSRVKEPVEHRDVASPIETRSAAPVSFAPPVANEAASYKPMEADMASHKPVNAPAVSYKPLEAAVKPAEPRSAAPIRRPEAISFNDGEWIVEKAVRF